MTIRENQRYVIISAESKFIYETENNRRTLNLGNCLRDLNMKFSTAKGNYKGQSEKSFFVNIYNNAELETLKDFAFENFNQESILYSDSSGNCTLEYNDGTSENIGQMRFVNPKLIESLDSYTIVNGKVLTTEKV